MFKELADPKLDKLLVREVANSLNLNNPSYLFPKTGPDDLNCKRGLFHNHNYCPEICPDNSRIKEGT